MHNQNQTLKYMQVILSPNLHKSALIVSYRIMAAAALVGLLFLSAISTADKFDEENYGVKVELAHVEYLYDNSSKMQDSLSVCRRV